MLNKQFRGLWQISCDGANCKGVFELNGYWDITPSKYNTIAVARQRKWKIGKNKQLCPICSGRLTQTISSKSGKMEE